MPSPTLLHFQQVSRRARRATRMVEEEQLIQKPKKVNSEIRKQQNRIASRNYREKRKKKLQYLQRLVEEGSNDGQTPEPTQQPQQAHVSSQVSQNDIGLVSPPFMLPSASGFVPLSSSGIPALDLAATSSSTTFDSHGLPTTQTYLPFGSSWNSQTLDSPSPSNTVYTPAWMNSIGGRSRPTLSPETFHFSVQASQAVFETTTDSYHCAGEVTPQAEHYALDSPYMSYNAPQSQAPSASSYFFHAPPHPFERFVFV